MAIGLLDVHLHCEQRTNYKCARPTWFSTILDMIHCLCNQNKDTLMAENIYEVFQADVF